MTVLQANETNELSLVEDEYVQDAIDSLFKVPIETFEMLQNRLITQSFEGNCDINGETTIRCQTTRNTQHTSDNNLDQALVPQETDLDASIASVQEDIEELQLESTITAGLSDVFHESREVALAKVDNFLSFDSADEDGDSGDDEDGFLKLTSAESSSPLKQDNVSRVNMNTVERENPYEVMVLNTIRPDDPFPGEAVDVYPETMFDLCNKNKKLILPILSTKNTNLCSGEEGNDIVTPFCLDESFDYDNNVHVPKYGAEVTALLKK